MQQLPAHRALLCADYRSLRRVAVVSVLLQVHAAVVSAEFDLTFMRFYPSLCSMFNLTVTGKKVRAPEHVGCILTVLNISDIDSGIRCTPLPRPAPKSRDFSEMRIIHFGFMMKSLVRRTCFPAQQPKLS